MHTPNHTSWRMALSDDPAVVASIEKYWVALTTSDATPPQNRTVSKEKYVSFAVKLCKALFGVEEFTREEAVRVANNDWTKDQGKKRTMNFAEFSRTIFEIADLWTVDVSARSYTSFLDKVFARITVTAFDNDSNKYTSEFKADLKIVSMQQGDGAGGGDGGILKVTLQCATFNQTSTFN
jgi:hypothetical protein